MPKHKELVPEKAANKLHEMLNPIDPQRAQSLIVFLVNELKEMFRELSEHRSSTEGKARQVLARRQTRLLDKIDELFPEAGQSVVEAAYSVASEVLTNHFDRQRGKKYK